jgi:hypothetical protein
MAFSDHANTVEVLPVIVAVNCCVCRLLSVTLVGVIEIVALGLIATVYACELVPPAESVTLSVNIDDPDAVGVPEIPPPLLSAKPAGNVPADTVQPYGASPPLAAALAVYEAPTFPPGIEVVVMARIPVMAIDADEFTCCPEASEAWTVKP